jgi:predicted GIY-YIG superfamily endonuclease
MHGGARRNAGRKRGIGLTYDIQKHCQKFIMELLENEAIKNIATQQLSEIVKKEKKQSHFIYLIESGGLIKIGYTTNFAKRIKNYKTHNTNLKILCVCEREDAFEIEAQLHKKYKQNCIKGEWFNLAINEFYDILNYINNGWQKKQ